MKIQHVIQQVILTFGDGIIIETRFVNILNDYGMFRENKALRTVLSDMLDVNLFAPLLTMSVDDMVKKSFRNKFRSNFLALYPYQEDVVNEIVDAIICAIVIGKDERSIHYWLNVFKEWRREKGDVDRIQNIDIFDVQRTLNRFGFMDYDGFVVVPCGINRIKEGDKIQIRHSSPHPFFDKWKMKDSVLYLLLMMAYYVNNRIDQKAVPPRFLAVCDRTQDEFYDWYFDFLKKKGSDKKCSFESRFIECKEKNLKVLKECFPCKDLWQLALCDVTDLFLELHLMDRKGKIVNISPGKVMPRFGAAKELNSDWSDLFEFVRFLYFASILQSQHIHYSPTKNMNVIIKEAHEMAKKELLNVN